VIAYESSACCFLEVPQMPPPQYSATYDTSGKKNQGHSMIRRALLLLAVAAIYLAVKSNRHNTNQPIEDKAADAQWANEGGANAPASV
jgi:hypothetical protein